MLLHRQKNLAAIFQAVFTNIVRLRSRRLPVTSEFAFRREMMKLLKSAEDEATMLGYSPESVANAKFALVTFLDNSVLDSQNMAFVQWGGLLLEQEWFGTNDGGQIFFDRFQRLLDQPDSRDEVDALEVYRLCVLLGFHGQLRQKDAGGAAVSMLDAAARKIARVRGVSGDLTPTWRIPEQSALTVTVDSWLPRLMVALLGSLVLALALFVGFHSALRSHISALEERTTTLAGR